MNTGLYIINNNYQYLRTDMLRIACCINCALLLIKLVAYSLFISCNSYRIYWKHSYIRMHLWIFMQLFSILSLCRQYAKICLSRLLNLINDDPTRSIMNTDQYNTESIILTVCINLLSIFTIYTISIIGNIFHFNFTYNIYCTMTYCDMHLNNTGCLRIKI